VTTPMNRDERRRHDAAKRRYYRYRDLEAFGIVSNRVTLNRWIKARGFPAPVRLGENTAAWIASEVDGWLEGRERARAAGENDQ
jgi:predicted DNA-binding transcriptional regulator AlpA